MIIDDHDSFDDDIDEDIQIIKPKLITFVTTISDLQKEKCIDRTKRIS